MLPELRVTDPVGKVPSLSFNLPELPMVAVPSVLVLVLVVPMAMSMLVSITVWRLVQV